MNHIESGEGSFSDISFGHGEKDIPLNTIGGSQDVESNSVGDGATAAAGNAQAGVKNIEAVSMVWTKWDLIAAYVRFVGNCTLRV
jgi:hypothetical protein